MPRCSLARRRRPYRGGSRTPIRCRSKWGTSCSSPSADAGHDGQSYGARSHGGRGALDTRDRARPRPGESCGPVSTNIGALGGSFFAVNRIARLNLRPFSGRRPPCWRSPLNRSLLRPLQAGRGYPFDDFSRSIRLPRFSEQQFFLPAMRQLLGLGAKMLRFIGRIVGEGQHVVETAALPMGAPLLKSARGALGVLLVDNGRCINGLFFTSRRRNARA